MKNSAWIVIVCLGLAAAAPGEESTSVIPPAAGEPAPVFQPPKSLGAASLWVAGAIALPAAYYAWAAVNQHYGYIRPVPLTILGAGLILGPSAGQFHAESWGKGCVGVGIRAAAVPAGLLAGSLVALGVDGGSMGDEAIIGGFGIAAAFWIYVAGTAYSLIDTPRAVKRANERARQEFEARISLSPAVFPLDEGRFAPGLAFSATF